MRFRWNWTRSLCGKNQKISPRERRLLQMAGASLLGIALGAFFVGRQWPQESPTLSHLLEQVVPEEPAAWFPCMTETFAAAVPYVVLLVLSGLTIFGGVAAPLVLLFHGLGLGTILGSLYRWFGWQGVRGSLVLVLPHEFFTVVLFLLIGAESVAFSRRMAMQTLEKSTAEGSSRLALKKYLLRCAVYSAALLLLAAVHGAVMVWCGGWFPLER